MSEWIVWSPKHGETREDNAVGAFRSIDALYAVEDWCDDFAYIHPGFIEADEELLVKCALNEPGSPETEFLVTAETSYFVSEA